MKTSLVITLIAGMFLTLTASSCLQGKAITGSKNYITKEVEPDRFNAIKLQSSADVTYYQDERFHIEIYGSDNIVPLVTTEVSNHTLIISFKKNCWIRHGKLEIKVFSPDLNKLVINGSGDVRLANGIQTEKDIELYINGSGDIEGKGFSCRKLTVGISGSGDIALQKIKSERCSASIAGSGDINLSGETTDAEYRIAGSGDIRAAKLEAMNVKASTAGSGDIECYASEKLTARVAGSGDIAYKGNPQEIDAPKKKIRRM